jgi:DNA modification methylase
LANPKQKLLFDESDVSSESEKSKPKRGGPPNRMNDLVYRDWMKFQKSFFRYESVGLLLERNIEFFTKRVWPDGTSSRVLILGFPDFDPSKDGVDRAIEHVPSASSVNEAIDTLRRQTDKYDFVFIDLTSEFRSPKLVGKERDAISDLYSLLRESLFDDRYCGIVFESNDANGAGFPVPWALSGIARKYLRLRDEKIGIRDGSSNIYCMYLQAADDLFRSLSFTPESLSIAKVEENIPSWIIPKPPPRRPNEILHPAKYPETLIEQFIELLCPEGGDVLDPMVGTGSTLVAALRTGRSGTGIELSEEFADIARQRVAGEPTMFTEESAEVITGNALDISELVESNTKFDYCITSPPYWSMLQNKGSEYQRGRRNKQLRTVYSDDESDLGNISDYDQFIQLLTSAYLAVSEVLATGAFLTVVIKNVKRNHTVFSAAWDLVSSLAGRDGPFEYAGCTLWCQDDVGMKPFAVGTHWVSNTVHTYCLHFRKP